jgi:hypothetical protein
MIKLRQFDLKHMDVASRNQRLREALEGMGLYVLPIFCESDSERIDYMHVSVALPRYVHGVTEIAASSAVAQPVTSSQIEEAVGPVESHGDNVVDLPTVVRTKPIL